MGTRCGGVAFGLVREPPEHNQTARMAKTCRSGMCCQDALASLLISISMAIVPFEPIAIRRNVIGL
jgi:hypothetical protein